MHVRAATWLWSDRTRISSGPPSLPEVCPADVPAAQDSRSSPSSPLPASQLSTGLAESLLCTPVLQAQESQTGACDVLVGDFRAMLRKLEAGRKARKSHRAMATPMIPSCAAAARASQPVIVQKSLLRSIDIRPCPRPLLPSFPFRHPRHSPPPITTSLSLPTLHRTRRAHYCPRWDRLCYSIIPKHSLRCCHFPK